MCSTCLQIKRLYLRKTKEDDMATYTITVNERTKEGRGLVRYLKALGVIEIPNETTRKAIKELDEGKGTVCNTFEEYLEAIK